MTKLRIWTHIYTLWLDFKINDQIGFNCPLFPNLCHSETHFFKNLSDPNPPHQQLSTFGSLTAVIICKQPLTHIHNSCYPQLSETVRNVQKLCLHCHLKTVKKIIDSPI